MSNARSRRIYILLTFFLFLIASDLKASHAVAADITYKHINGLTYEFTYTFYRDCDGISAPQTVTLAVSSTNCAYSRNVIMQRSAPPREVSAICGAEIGNTTCNGGSLPGIQEYKYTTTFTLPNACTDWTFGVGISARNNIITNLSSGGSLYVEATMDNLTFPDNNSLQFANIPVPFTCSNQLYSHSDGAYDVDGDLLEYELITPLVAKNTPSSYVSGLSSNYPLFTTSGSIGFNLLSGQLSFTPLPGQVAVVTVRVKEYRNGILIGSTIRDIQIIILTCNNRVPEFSSGTILAPTAGKLQSPNHLSDICPGDLVEFQLEFSDPDLNNSLTVTSNLSTSIPGATISFSGTNPMMGHFSWLVPPSSNLINSFSVTVRDDACQVNASQTFAFRLDVSSGIFAGVDKTFCLENDSIQLRVLGSSGYRWSVLSGDFTPPSCTDCFNPFVSPTTTTQYLVSTPDSVCGSVQTDTVNVFVTELHSVMIDDGSGNLCNSESQLGVNITTVNGVFTYDWSPSVGLSNTTIPNPIASAPGLTEYTVRIEDGLGCEFQKKVPVLNQTFPNLRPVNLCDSTLIVNFGQCDSSNLSFSWSPSTNVTFENNCFYSLKPDRDTTYILTITNGLTGCTHKDTFEVNVKELKLNIPDTIVHCSKGQPLSICALEDTTNLLFFWGGPFISGASSNKAKQNIMIPPPAYIQGNIFNYTLNIIDGICANTFTFKIQVDTTGFEIDLSDTLIVCEDSSLVSVNVFPVGNYSYMWSPPNGIISTNTENPIIISNDTSIKYYVSVRDNDNYCSRTDSIIAIVSDDFSVDIHQNQFFCPKDSVVTLSGVISKSKGIEEVIWSPGSSFMDSLQLNQTFTPTKGVTYSLRVIDSLGCEKYDSIFVNMLDVSDRINISAIGDTTIVFGTNLTLVANANGNPIIWSSGGIIIDSLVNSIQVSPDSTTEYFVFSENQCFSDSALITVIVIEEEKFLIPNVITPNGDGINDFFKVSQNPGAFRLQVFNRWGELIYKSNRYENDWGGALKNAGMFYFILEHNKIKGKKYSGWLTVLK